MAKREALRELQSRLAERMLEARSQPRRRSWLAVECRGRGFLFPLEQAGEIFSMVPLVSVPHTQPWFAGVANLRGGLHAVVDLARFLGLDAAAESGREQARLVAFNTVVGLQCALLVERLAGLRHAEQLADRTEGAPPAADAPRPAFAGALLHDADGRAWQEIQLVALAEHEQFLAVGRP